MDGDLIARQRSVSLYIASSPPGRCYSLILTHTRLFFTYHFSITRYPDSYLQAVLLYFIPQMFACVITCMSVRRQTHEICGTQTAESHIYILIICLACQSL